MQGVKNARTKARSVNQIIWSGNKNRWGWTMKTTITPEIAKRILEKNTINRPMNKSNVAFLVSEICRNNFIYNGEPIIISKDGFLLDGQHRLQACVESGRAIEALIVRDVEKEAMITIDTGRARTASDVFSLKNIDNATAVASACKNIISKFNTVRKLYDSEAATKAGKVKVSNTDVLKFYNKNKDEMQELTRYSERLIKHGLNILTLSQVSAYIYLFSYEDNSCAIDFFRELITDAKLRDGTAAKLLRTKLLNDKISKTKLARHHIRDLIIKSFRSYCADKEIKILKLIDSEIIEFKNVDVFKEKPFIDLDYISSVEYIRKGK